MKTLRLTHPIDIDGAPISSFVVGGPDGVVSIEPAGLGWDVTQVRGETQRTITVFPGGAVWGDWKPKGAPKQMAPPPNTASAQDFNEVRSVHPLADEDNPNATPPKRKPGRPRKVQP
jgi:hypothetical protein